MSNHIMRRRGAMRSLEDRISTIVALSIRDKTKDVSAITGDILDEIAVTPATDLAQCKRLRAWIEHERRLERERREDARKEGYAHSMAAYDGGANALTRVLCQLDEIIQGDQI